MLRQSATTLRKRAQFTRDMEWGPDVIFAFPRGVDGRFDECLYKYRETSAGTLSRKVDPRVRHINLGDPSRQTPWNVQELQMFKVYATEAVEHLKRDKKVLVVCVGGKNRSPAFCEAVMHLARADGAHIDGVISPTQDPDLKRVVEAIEDDKVLEALAPLGSRCPKRGRDV